MSSLAVIGLSLLSSPRHVEWISEEVHFLVTAAERSRFEELASDEERDRFIELFWRLRDPSPATLSNEARDLHYARLAEADRLFGAGARRGRFEERGRIWILLGPPSFRESFASAGKLVPTELWHYTGMSRAFLPESFYLIFFRPRGGAPFRLFRPLGDGPSALLSDPEPARASTEELREIDPELGAVVEELLVERGNDAERLLASLDGYAELEQRHRSASDSVRVSASFRTLRAELVAVVLEDDVEVSEVHYAFELSVEEMEKLRVEIPASGEREMRFTLAGRLFAHSFELDRWEDVLTVDAPLPSRPLSFRGRRLLSDGADQIEMSLVDEGGAVASVRSDLERVVVARPVDETATMPARFPFRTGGNLVSPLGSSILSAGPVVALVSIVEPTVVTLLERDALVLKARLSERGTKVVPLPLDGRPKGKYRLVVSDSRRASERELDWKPGATSSSPRILVRESTPAEEARYRVQRAKQYSRRGDRVSAIAEMELAVSAAPSDLRNQLELATLRYAEGRHDEVIAQLEAASRLLPEDPDLFVILAASCEALGRLERAIAFYQKANALSPGDVGIEQALDRILARRDR